MNTENFIKMPELGEGVTEGELVKWCISLGDNIKTDQLVAEVMTDKAVMEIPSPVEGVVESFLVKEGDTIPVGHNLLKLKSADTSKKASLVSPVSQEPSASQTQEVVTKPQKSSFSDSEASQKSKSSSFLSNEDKGQEGALPNKQDLSDIKASPSTRRWAKELKIDISQVTPARNDGRITQEDILQYLQQERQKSPPLKGPNQTGYAQGATSKVFSTSKQDVKHEISNKISILSTQQGFEVLKEEGQERQPLKGIRKKIAQKMQASKAVIPHFTLLESAEVDQLDKLKSSVKETLNQTGYAQGATSKVFSTSKQDVKHEILNNLSQKNIKVTYLSFVMKALLETVKNFPALNASIDDVSQEIVYKNYYHFGFAVDTNKGLLVPVIKNVDQKSLAELSYEIQTLAEKARQGLGKAEDMKGGTITITNIGSLGGEYATPIINAPESAILGMYRVFVKACWDGSQFVPKKTMNFSLTCDHRLIDGALSARALKFFIHKIENPLSLFI